MDLKVSMRIIIGTFFVPKKRWWYIVCPADYIVILVRMKMAYQMKLERLVFARVNKGNLDSPSIDEVVLVHQIAFLNDLVDGLVGG